MSSEGEGAVSTVSAASISTDGLGLRLLAWGGRAIGWMFGRLFSRLVARLFSLVDAGRITIVAPSGKRFEHAGGKPGPDAVMVLRNWRAIRKLAAGGDVGLAEAYVAGDWTSPDLTALIEFAATNGAGLEKAIGGMLAVRAIDRLRHLLKSNSRAGSRRNVAFHYDLGNDFYRLWLDDGMIYSSAMYAGADESLEAAQAAKLRRIVELLDLEGGDEILEIGCGWGALAARLGRENARVTALTLSAEQHACAQALVDREALGERVAIRLQDYRDARGSFDRVVSIEMLEAVGERYWPTYFEALRARLKPGGRAVLQVITIDEERFEGYRSRADFIQRHVFPGGMLPTKTIIAERSAHAGLELVSTETFGASYALTLAEWRQRFHEAWPAIEKLGFDTAFRRLWEYYLCYCEAGFRTGAIDVGFYTLQG